MVHFVFLVQAAGRRADVLDWLVGVNDDIIIIIIIRTLEMTRMFQGTTSADDPPGSLRAFHAAADNIPVGFHQPVLVGTRASADIAICYKKPFHDGMLRHQLHGRQGQATLRHRTHRESYFPRPGVYGRPS